MCNSISAGNSLARNFEIAWEDKRITKEEVRAMRAALVLQTHIPDAYSGINEVRQNVETAKLTGEGYSALKAVADEMYPKGTVSICESGTVVTKQCEDLYSRYWEACQKIAVAKALSAYLPIELSPEWLEAK